MKRPKYYITTWDTDKQTFTPQAGVRKGPYTLFGLRKAIRKLREMGYPCDHGTYSGDPAVYVSTTRPYWRLRGRALKARLNRESSRGPMYELS